MEVKLESMEVPRSTNDILKYLQLKKSGKAYDRDWKDLMTFANDDHPGKVPLGLVPSQLTSTGHLDGSKILMP